MCPATDQQADVCQRRQIMGALFDARYHFEQALVHGFSMSSRRRARNSRDSIIQDRGDRGLRVVGQPDDLLEVSGAQCRHERIPKTAIANGSRVRLHVPLDGDRYADHEYQGQWYRNTPPSLKKLTAEFMKFIFALLNKLFVRICNSTRFRKIAMTHFSTCGGERPVHHFGRIACTAL